MGQYPAGQELTKLLLDEAGQAATVAAVRDFTEEEIKVLTNDDVEHGVLSVAGAIRGGGTRHDHGYCVRGAAQMPKDRYMESVLGRVPLSTVGHSLRPTYRRSAARAAGTSSAARGSPRSPGS